MLFEHKAMLDTALLKCTALLRDCLFTTVLSQDVTSISTLQYYMSNADQHATVGHVATCSQMK